MQQLCRCVGSVVMALIPLQARSQSTDSLPPADESARFEVTKILDGLDNPWGLTIRPGRDRAGPHELFVAESGAGRVVRVLTNEPKKVHEAISGFPVRELDSPPAVTVGPLGLAFLTRTKLMVTGGHDAEGNSDVRVYVLPGSNTPLGYEAYDHAVATRPSAKPGNLMGIANGETAAFVTRADRDAPRLVLKADIERNQLETLRPFGSGKTSSGLVGPAEITLTPSDRPQFLVVGEQGSSDEPRDSRLTFLSLDNGRALLSLATGLHDISGLAYSPSGQLYAVDAAWNSAAGQGGVFRLDDARVGGRQGCRAVKIASVNRGVSFAFAPDGTLYVTALGAKGKSGAVFKISGKF